MHLLNWTGRACSSEDGPGEGPRQADRARECSGQHATWQPRKVCDIFNSRVGGLYSQCEPALLWMFGSSAQTTPSRSCLRIAACRQRLWPGKPTETSYIHGTTRSPCIHPLHRSDRTVSIGVFPAYSANGTYSTIVYYSVAEQPHAATTQRNANPTQRRTQRIAHRYTRMQECPRRANRQAHGVHLRATRVRVDASRSWTCCSAGAPSRGAPTQGAWVRRAPLPSASVPLVTR